VRTTQLQIIFVAWVLLSTHLFYRFLFRERGALQNVKDIRLEEHMRIAHKQKKHETFLRNQLLDELHTDFVQSIIKPIRDLTGAMLMTNCWK
jgi:hypothetical protein